MWRYAHIVRAFPLFTIAGIPVSVSPWYFLLLYMFARGDVVRGVIWGVGITVGLLVHELGHALVARYLRHNPSILLHGWGGLTSRSRTGRDVEEALIIAMGPAAGLLLGLVVAAAWFFLIYLVRAGHVVVLSRPVYEAFSALLMPTITWNILNLVPLWPLDGGQLFRLGAVRVVGARHADKLTHGLALLLLALIFAWLGSGISGYSIVLLGLLGFQNVQALRGAVSSGPVQVTVAHGKGLVTQARAAFARGDYREAARVAHQARANAQLARPLLEEVWEILGLATWQLAEPEEALSYLRRAAPSAAVRAATEACLVALGRQDELDDIRDRWQLTGRGRHLDRALIAALAFIAGAVTLVFTTGLSRFFL